MDTPSDIGDMAEALLHQESGHLHAARAVVAQASNGMVAVQLFQPQWHGVHGDREQLKTLRCDAGGLNFPGFTHIQHDSFAVRGLRCDPVLQLSRLNLIDHAVTLELEA